MHLSSQEEFGMRCLLRLAHEGHGGMLTIQEIARAERISVPHAAKLMRILREGGLVMSERGQAGGYHLARTPEEITAKEVLNVLGGTFYGGDFCERFAGHEHHCTHSIDCSIRSLWRAVQAVVDNVLDSTSVRDLMCGEREMDSFVEGLVLLEGGMPQVGARANHG